MSKLIHFNTTIIRGERIKKNWQCKGNETNLLVDDCSGGSPNSCNDTRAGVSCTGEFLYYHITAIVSDRLCDKYTMFVYKAVMTSM